MNITKKICCFIFITLFCFTGVTTPNKANDNNHQHILTILHTNDLHGYILPHKNPKLFRLPKEVGGAAHKAALISLIRKEANNVLLLDAGDIAQGTPVSNYFYGIPVIEVMNNMKYDALALGNHDFDWGATKLSDMIKKAAFPVLASNIINKTTRKYFPGTVPYIIKQIDDIKIGIIGVITPDTYFITRAENIKDYEFIQPEVVLPPLISELKNQNVNIIILLSHLGVDKDRKVALSVKGIDIIVGGHSHTVLSSAVLEGNTIIVQAGSYGDYLGKLTLTINDQHKITNYQSGLIPVDSAKYKEDQDIAMTIKPYTDKVKPIMSEVIGYAKKNLLRSSKKESALGNFICDVLRNTTNADISFYNSGGIRSDILHGPITMEEIFFTLPFENNVVTMELTGAEILDILEQSVSGDHGIMQVSGLSFIFDSLRPKQERILKVTLTNGNPLDYKKTYRVTTNDFVAQGGDRYETFKKRKSFQYSGLVRDIITAHIKKHQRISSRIEKRIVEISSEIKSKEKTRTGKEILK